MHKYVPELLWISDIAVEDEADIFIPVLLDEEHQFKEVSVEGKPLDHWKVEHICKA